MVEASGLTAALEGESGDVEFVFPTFDPEVSEVEVLNKDPEPNNATPAPTTANAIHFSIRRLDGLRGPAPSWVADAPTSSFNG